MHSLVIAASLVIGAPVEHASERDPEALPITRLERFFARPKPISPRFLDHGTLALAAFGGAPHRYRVELRTGLFDVVSVGVTAHWLPGQPWPRVWPVGALALWRSTLFEVGAHYRPVLFPAVDRSKTFEPDAHFALASFTLGSGLFAAGLDVGVANLRVPDLLSGDPTRSRRESMFGGGFVVRVGNEWIGGSLDALAAVGDDEVLLVLEAGLELRFDLARAR
jgi:hypothetical protein